MSKTLKLTPQQVEPWPNSWENHYSTQSCWQFGNNLLQKKPMLQYATLLPNCGHQPDQQIVYLAVLGLDTLFNRHIHLVDPSGWRIRVSRILRPGTSRLLETPVTQWQTKMEKAFISDSRNRLRYERAEKRWKVIWIDMNWLKVVI